MFTTKIITTLVILFFFIFIFISCAAEDRDIYLVLLEGEPVAFNRQNLSPRRKQGEKLFANSEASKVHAKFLVESHDHFLESKLDAGSYSKFYSFKHIVNGFAVHTSSSQVEKLRGMKGVRLVERDRGAKVMTSYNPEFLGVESVWSDKGGEREAGDGIVIGFVDSGINPVHPSFAYDPMNPWGSNATRFSGSCEEGPLFPRTSCNGKIVGARFFATGAQAVATFNPSVDILSPYDAVGHGRIAMYKAIYPSVGTLADVLAAIDQAVLDGVDILTLSIGPNSPPQHRVTFLGAFDIFMLSARKAGVFVSQAVGNQGPGPYTVFVINIFLVLCIF